MRIVSSRYECTQTAVGEVSRNDEVLPDISPIQVLVELGEVFGLFKTTQDILRFRRKLERVRSFSAGTTNLVQKTLETAYFRQHNKWPDDEMGQWRIQHDLRTFWGTQRVELPYYVRRQHQLLVAIGWENKLSRAS